VTDLLDRVADLVAIASPSHHETAMADHVEARLRTVPWLVVTRVGDNVVARTAGSGTRLVLAGHLDTVPANGNATPRRDGDVLWGLGTADMKGGLAVVLELVTAGPVPPIDLTLVFYVAEEVARVHSGLLAVERERPDLLVGDAAILGEPTGAVVEAGCQGVVKLDVTLGGRRAHTARPWMGVNAVHRLGPVLDLLAATDHRRPVIDGCTYREALQAVAVQGGVAGNVVPDTVRLSLNHRYAPDRDATQAEAAVRTLLRPVVDEAAGDRIEVTEHAPAAPPGLRHPLLADLLAATGAPPRAKLGWTDVAFFAERGIPAVNFGPGDPELAHTADERVTGADLRAVLAALRRVVHGPTPAR
jgi:succinyl-diaminopimelate desuccinylase